MKSAKAKRLNKIEEYYFSSKLREIEEMNRSGENVINLGIGNPDLRPPAGVVDKLTESSKDPGNHGYQSYRGISALRQAFSEWYKIYYGVDLDPDSEILPLMGSKEGIFYISMAFLNEGDKVLVPDPGYPTYKAVSEMVGGEAVPYDLTEKNRWFPDLDSLDKSDLSQVKLMWVNYPHMPTGAKANRSFFKELVDFGKKHDIILCHDNPYSFILGEDPISLLETENSKNYVLELNSLSKSHNMAGWRVGMIAGNPEFINYINDVTSNIQSGMFLPIQYAAIKALENSKSWYFELNKTYSMRRDLVWEILESLGCIFGKDQGGLFVWARIPGESDSYDFSDEILRKTRIFITPGSIFGKNGSGYIRISLCSPEEVLLEAKERIVQNFK